MKRGDWVEFISSMDSLHRINRYFKYKDCLFQVEVITTDGRAKLRGNDELFSQKDLKVIEVLP